MNDSRSVYAPVVRPVRATAATLLALHAARPTLYPALLESATSGTASGRFDILFAHPQESIVLRSDGQLAGRAAAIDNNSFLAALDRWWQQQRVPSTESPLPFRGGWFVYLGYELAGQIEPRLKLRAPATGPIATAVRVPAAVIFDHSSNSAYIVTEGDHSSAVTEIESHLALASPLQESNIDLLDGNVIEDAPEDYLLAVRRALNYIASGDIYQANLSRGWRATLKSRIEPYQLYQNVRRTNPGPFCALAVLPEFAIVSSSPERLVQARNGWVATRPIAGTRPRGVDSIADDELAKELHAHPKERAEHIMLIDLERNDLGRICVAGSVAVDEYMTIESYAHVHHIVSNVRGRIRDDVTPGQVIAAVFPGGTITGCPKVRCMEIIAELEDTARGAYTGSLGYLNLDGSMDFNILIRSLQVNGSAVTLRAGAGIVADSVPERELEESRVKARGVLHALNRRPL